MKTRADDAIARFMAVLLETEEIDEKLQELLDFVRVQYGLDVVYIMVKAGSDNVFSFRYVSASKPEYDKTGIRVKVTDEDCEAGIHMYDDSPICGFNVDTAKNYGISDCIIHYGFVRKESHSYDGSIGFQCFTPHTWTKEEEAVLLKLGKLYKMILSVPLSEGVNEHLYTTLEQERRQYRDALTKGSEYGFSFDITDDMIREKIITASGLDIIADLGLPCQWIMMSSRRNLWRKIGSVWRTNLC